MRSHSGINASTEQLTDKQPVVWSNAERRWGEVFLKQSLFGDQLESTIRNFLAGEGRLFLVEKEFELDIFTEPLRLATAADAIRELCATLGYRVLAMTNKTKQGKYLGSDGGGHYSTDYYEIINYACITLVSA